MTAKTKFSLGVIAASVLALITGCGGGGGGGTTPPVQPPADTRAPVVTSFTAQVLGTTTKIDIMKAGAVDVPKNAFFVAEVDEVTQGCPTDQPVVKTFDKIEASFTCAKNSAGTGSVWTIVPTASLADGAKITITLGPTDAAGNQGSLATSFTIAVPPPAAATVTLAAPPNPITVGDQATLTWVTKNAANCLATGGWTGSVSNTGGTQVVAPTVTTTYSIECWNSANITTGVISATVTVNPAPAKLEYTDVVVAIWPGFPDWPADTSGIVRIDRNSPKGYLPNKNLTGKQFYFTGIRPVPRADCLMELSSLDTTGAEIKVLYNLKTGEQTLDTSAAGAAWNRVTDYRYTSYGSDSVHLLWATSTQVTDGLYYIVDTEHENLYFQSNAGVVTQVIKSTFAATGGINGIWTYSCKAQ